MDRRQAGKKEGKKERRRKERKNSFQVEVMSETLEEFSSLIVIALSALE